MTEAKQRIRRMGAFRVGLAVLVAFAILVPVAVFAASPEPSGSLDPNATATASASVDPSATAEPTTTVEPSASASAPAPAGTAAPGATTKPDTTKPNGFKGDGGRGGHGFGAITIASIDGSKIGLKTADGWSRTITVTADTKITKGGKTITVADLNVADKVTFRQKRNADGTYTIVSINVPVPTAQGKVTAIGSSTLTIAGRGGKTRTITVNGATDYHFGKDAATKGDIVVGSQIFAQGTVSGETFTASSVRIIPSAVGGEVTAKTSTSVTIKTRAGKTVVLHVDSSTKVYVAGKGKTPGTLADIAVGDKVTASGALRADGSIDADVIGGHGKRVDKTGPGASPKPSGPTT